MTVEQKVQEQRKTGFSTFFSGANSGRRPAAASNAAASKASAAKKRAYSVHSLNFPFSCPLSPSLFCLRPDPSRDVTLHVRSRRTAHVESRRFWCVQRHTHRLHSSVSHVCWCECGGECCPECCSVRGSSRSFVR